MVIRRSDGTEVRAEEQGAAGAAVVIPTWSLGEAGNFILEVSASSTSRVTLEAARNAAWKLKLETHPFRHRLG